MTSGRINQVTVRDSGPRTERLCATLSKLKQHSVLKHNGGLDAVRQQTTFQVRVRHRRRPCTTREIRISQRTTEPARDPYKAAAIKTLTAGQQHKAVQLPERHTAAGAQTQLCPDRFPLSHIVGNNDSTGTHTVVPFHTI